MVIPTINIIKNARYTGIEENDLVIMCLCVLYHNKLINNSQLSIYCKRYDNPYRNLYHCPFNDVWYNDCWFLDALLDVVNYNCTHKQLEINDYLNYLNIGFNKNKNWCVNYIGNNWILPIINDCFNGRQFDCHKGKLLLQFNVGIDLPLFEDVEYELSNGYCCSDCDGCLHRYKQSRYNHYYAPNKDKIKSIFGQKLILYKTHNNNPMDMLKINFNI